MVNLCFIRSSISNLPVIYFCIARMLHILQTVIVHMLIGKIGLKQVLDDKKRQCLFNTISCFRKQDLNYTPVSEDTCTWICTMLKSKLCCKDNVAASKDLQNQRHTPPAVSTNPTYVNVSPGGNPPLVTNPTSGDTSSGDYIDLGCTDPQQPSTYTELQLPPQIALYVNSGTSLGTSSPRDTSHPQVSEGISSGDYMDLGMRGQDSPSTYTELQPQRRVQYVNMTLNQL